MSPYHFHGPTRLLVLLCAFLSITSASPIAAAATSLPALYPTINASSPDTAEAYASLPASYTSTLTLTTTTATSSSSGISWTSMAAHPLSFPVIVGCAVLFLIMLGCLARSLDWLPSSSRKHCLATDAQLLRCWANHGTGRLFLANHHGVTDQLYSGYLGSIPLGWFVVCETGTRRQMQACWVARYGSLHGVHHTGGDSGAGGSGGGDGRGGWKRRR